MKTFPVEPILYDKEMLREEQNVDVFCAVHDYFKYTHCFHWRKEFFLYIYLSSICCLFSIFSCRHEFNVLLCFIIMITIKYLYIYVSVILMHVVNCKERPFIVLQYFMPDFIFNSD